MSNKFLTRVFHKTIKTDTGCWEYTGHLNRGGYGWCFYKGRSINTHRAVLIETSGKIPKGLHACHSCDNRKCINPAHLWWGTAFENARDMVSKGRSPKPFGDGKIHCAAKLTEKQVHEIRVLGKMGQTYVSIAKKFPVGRLTVSLIIRRKIWMHI